MPPVGTVINFRLCEQSVNDYQKTYERIRRLLLDDSNFCRLKLVRVEPSCLASQSSQGQKVFLKLLIKKTHCAQDLAGLITCLACFTATTRLYNVSERNVLRNNENITDGFSDMT